MFRKIWFYLKPIAGIFWSSASTVLMEMAREAVAERKAER